MNGKYFKLVFISEQLVHLNHSSYEFWCERYILLDAIVLFFPTPTVSIEILLN